VSGRQRHPRLGVVVVILSVLTSCTSSNPTAVPSAGSSEPVGAGNSTSASTATGTPVVPAPSSVATVSAASPASETAAPTGAPSSTALAAATATATATATAGEPSPAPSAGETPPSGPARTPGTQPDPTAAADAVLSATTEDDRIAAIMNVLAGIGIGVHGTDGTPILYGAERNASDFWLYDFEVRLLAESQGDNDPFTLDTTAGALAAAGISNAGQPVSVDDIAAAVHDSVAAAVADPSDPKSFIELVIRELGLRAGTPYDLANPVPAGQVQLGALSSFLILADELLPIIQAATPAVAATSLTASVDGLTASSIDPCNAVVSWANKSSWDAGKKVALFIAGVISNGVNADKAQISILHSILESLSIRPSHSGPVEVHYSHGAPNPQTYEFGLEVYRELPQAAISCGLLAGVPLPQLGPLNGVPVSWTYGGLQPHGTVKCDATCTKTVSGSARLVFTPKTESAPVGLGPTDYDRALITAHADLSAYFGITWPNVAITYMVWDVEIDWHRAYSVDLAVISNISGNQILRGRVSAAGRIHINFDVGGDNQGFAEGPISTHTTALSVAPCYGQVKVVGTGDVGIDVSGLSIAGQQETPADPPANSIVMDIGPSGLDETDDSYTIPPCHGIPFSYPQIGSFWVYLFGLSHIPTVQTDHFLTVTDWTWKATDATFESGGLLAEKVYTETCGGSCSGKTTLQLYITPIDQTQP